MRLKKINNNIKTVDAFNCRVKSMQVHQTNEQTTMYTNLKIKNFKSKFRVNMVV